MTHSFSSPHKTPAPSRDDILSPSWQWLSWWQWNWRKILIWNCHFVPRIKNTVYLKSSSNKHPSQLLPENFLCFLFSFSDAAAVLGGHCAICANVCLFFLVTLFQTALMIFILCKLFIHNIWRQKNWKKLLSKYLENALAGLVFHN